MLIPHRAALRSNTSIVNELSNTMDLESTLIKAEALFGRYRRLVEAVDKKENFPTPRKLEDASSPPATPGAISEATSGQASNGKKQDQRDPKNKGKGQASKEEEPRVITPELRKLLSRQVEVLPRTTVAQKGDGMPDRTTQSSD